MVVDDLKVRVEFGLNHFGAVVGEWCVVVNSN